MRKVIVLLAVLALAACSSKTNSPTVPRLSASAGASGARGAGPERKAALHAAAECIRQHGVPAYQDPVMTPDGHVYTDARAFGSSTDEVVAAVESACKDLMVAAQFEPMEEAPAPPKLVAAGVKSRQCLRDHGLTRLSDPTAQSQFTPGHGFGLNPDEMPGDKTDPTVQAAFNACRAIMDEEARLSSLGNLGDA